MFVKNVKKKLKDILLNTLIDTEFKNNIVNGQLFFRETEKNTKDLDCTDRKLYIVLGIVAVPSNLEIKGEHQYAVAGCAGELIIDLENSIDISKISIGSGLGGLVTQPIWRI